ncbi:MAG TPA: trypsin-like peptidase domain-containing protein [Cyclobacteriaceae bacterium]
MTRRQFFLTVLFASFFGAMVAFAIFLSLSPNDGENFLNTQSDGFSISEKQSMKTANANRPAINYEVPATLNFIDAADEVISGVVHIQSIYSKGSVTDLLNPYRRGPAVSSGSGVILTVDGYIATNNHVIEDASEVRVTLFNNRSYLAKVIGSDPQTDLALLKIQADNLDFIPYGNSDEVAIGEWVLAVGNPFNLNSTVTAGIVSAKARNIQIFNENGLEIESFIQTDAAVNPGNSGGALVNLKGELIGVNTAIATQTGSYEGYSFAVPVSLVRKVMDDLLEFGNVQRGLLGIIIRDVDARLAEVEGLSMVTGVYVPAVNPSSAAEEAGIQSGDVIIEINNIEVKNSSELQELVARHRPGDEILVTYMRKDQRYEVKAQLRNFVGNTELDYRPTSSTISGAHFEDVPKSEQVLLGISGGARLKQIEEGKWTDTGIEKGFVITSIDKINVDDAEDLRRIMSNKSGGILVEGINSDGDSKLFALNW